MRSRRRWRLRSVRLAGAVHRVCTSVLFVGHDGEHNGGSFGYESEDDETSQARWTVLVLGGRRLAPMPQPLATSHSRMAGAQERPGAVITDGLASLPRPGPGSRRSRARQNSSRSRTVTCNDRGERGFIV